MDPLDAASQSARGGLVGMGCEAHEAKVAARDQRRNEKRKIRSESRAEVKKSKKGRDRADQVGHGAKILEMETPMDREERLMATGEA